MEPNGTAVIFVHGLMGEAVGTWSDFERLLLKSEKCAGRDLLFYPYNSADARTGANATLFYSYLGRLLKTPSAVVTEDSALARRRETNS